MLALWGSGAFKAGGSDIANPHVGNHQNNQFRKNIIDIDVFEPPLNRYGKVGRSCVLQPQQHFRARCLQNTCKTQFVIRFSYESKSFFTTIATRSWLSDPGYQILASRSWLQILAIRSWPPDPGYQILATRSWLPDLSFQILATRS